MKKNLYILNHISSFVFIYICCVFLFASCEKENVANNDDINHPRKIQTSLVTFPDTLPLPEYLIGIPFASDNELAPYSDEGNTDCYSTMGVLNYRLARDYAFAEFLSHIDTYILETQIIEELNAELSTISITEKPVIVYDYSNKPFYYEFPIIYREQQIIGTIAVAAQPFNTELIHYMFPFPLDYESYDFTYRRYVGEYPLVYYSNDNGSSFYKFKRGSNREYELQQVEEDYYIADIHDAMLAKLSELSQDELDAMYLDLQDHEYINDPNDIIDNTESYADRFVLTQETRDFWQNIRNEYVDSEIITPSGIIPNIVLDWINENLSEISATYQGSLLEYRNHGLRLTHWDDYCGPAVMSWLYRGKYDCYNNVYLPTYYDDPLTNDYPLFISAYNSTLGCYVYSEYDMAPSSSQSNTYETRQENSNSTDGGLYYGSFQYTTQIGNEYPLLDWGLRSSLRTITNNAFRIKFITAPIAWIENKRQPVVVEGIRGHAHYCAAIGYSYNQRLLIKTYLRLLVTDNGFFIRHHHHYPYWSILGGLNYAWERNN